MSSYNNGIIERRGKLTNAGITDFSDNVDLYQRSIESSGPEGTSGIYKEETHRSIKVGYQARASFGSYKGRHCLLKVVFLLLYSVETFFALNSSIQRLSNFKFDYCINIKILSGDDTN